MPPLCLRFEPSPPLPLLPVAVVATAPADGGGVEWQGRVWHGMAGYGMVWYGELWWWKLCVFLCHIPIYINLVFAMTDDICQCQTFSFSISASPLSLSFALSGSARQGRASPGSVVGLKVTFPKDSPAQRPRFQNIGRPLANLPSPTLSTHQFSSPIREASTTNT